MKLKINLPEKIFNIESGLILLYVNPILLIVAFLISINMVVMPRINDIENTNTKITEVKNENLSVLDKINYLKSVDENELIKNAQLLDNSVLKERNSYVLVKVLRNIADKFGFQIKSFSISPGKLDQDDKLKVNSNDLTAKLPISVTLIGPQEKSLDFLLLLENSLPILTIDSFETKTNGSTTELNLAISSFYVGDREKSNLLNLSLADLTLKKNEMDLIKKLSQFEKVDETPVLNNVTTGQGEFKTYQRDNPFSL
ncbi:MAG: hypothetical protein Q8P53_01280 [Candidatus Shapirobacteria bacterium]|nr:hypothetical protein [Candidatus Shapirobacteria bacterium]